MHKTRLCYICVAPESCIFAQDTTRQLPCFQHCTRCCHIKTRHPEVGVLMFHTAGRKLHAHEGGIFCAGMVDQKLYWDEPGISD